MATKLQRMSELSIQTTNGLTHSIDTWLRFLDSAAWLYKYPFPEQVLIHAQRPDAKACASMDLWNNTFKRWVTKGAKGIALIDDSGEKPKLRYVFDVSDTNSRYRIPFSLWQQKEQDEDQIIEELSNHFGEPDDIERFFFPEQLIGIIHNAVADNSTDYARELLYMLGGSNLEDYDDFNVKVWFEQMLEMSVAYATLTRLGFDPNEYLDKADFSTVLDFNTPNTIVQLGTATADMTEMVLRQVERTVYAIRKQERDTLAQNAIVLQNEVEKDERSNSDGNQLQHERGLFDSQYRDGQTEYGEHREVRTTSEEVPQGESEGILQHAASDEQPDRTPDRDQSDSAGADRSDGLADGADRESDREDESREPNALDSTDEQHSAERRGDGTERPDLRITEYSLFPTLEEQLQRIEEAEAQKLTAFSVSQADIDNELCRHGSGFEQGKFRIYKFFEGMPSSDAAIAFLKKEYGIGGHSHTYLNGESGFVDHDGKGIRFSNRHYKDSVNIPWKTIEKRLRELIAIDRYLTEKEKAYLPEYEAKEAERRLQLAEEAAAREALRAAAAAMDERRKDAQYSFSLGDAVQLGATQYTILGYDEHAVMLSDPKYPLLSEDMARDVFERRLRENPANDHLIIETEPAASNEETESKAEIVTETVEVISAEENHLPYDVVIQTIRTEEQEPVKTAEKTNFRITDDALGHGGPKAKFRMNMDAIRTLQTIEFEQRLATPEEQEVLGQSAASI